MYKHKNTLLFLFVSLLLALLNLAAKLYRTPAWFDGTLARNHALLLDFNYTNNEQSRLFQFYVPEAFVQMFGLSFPDAYILQRVLFTLLTFFLFFLYARKWFQDSLAAVCVITMAVLMPLTYKNHLQESAALLSLTFLGAVWAIREKKPCAFAVILLVGSINNETMLFLPAIYFFVNFTSFEFKQLFQLAVKTVLLALPAFIAVGYIRYLNIDRPHLGGALHFAENLKKLHHLAIVFNVFWLCAYLGFKNKPQFLQRSLLAIPLFIIPHLITGIISETRQMIPLSCIILPSAYIYLAAKSKRAAHLLKPAASG